MILRLALPTPLDRLFDYRYSGAAPVVGARVQVNFSGRPLIGFVVEIAQSSEVAQDKLKSIDAVLDQESPFSAELWNTLQFAARYYMHSLGEVLTHALPLSMRKSREVKLPGQDYIAIGGEWREPLLSAERLDAVAKTAVQKQLLERLVQEHGNALSTLELDAQLPDWKKSATSLQKRGILERYRISAFSPPPRTVPGPVLNAEQQAAVDAIQVQAGKGYGGFLLFGLTGSGKTEVYMQSMAHALAAGGQALLLVPEIGLTPQTVQRVRERLHARVGVLHSQRSEGENALTWQAARNGELDVVIGTRSAVFCQFPNLRLIVVDEEHDGSYKQGECFRFHARDLASKRAQSLNIPIVMGSATPSLEVLQNARLQRVEILHLRERAGGAQLPEIALIDLRVQSHPDGLAIQAEQHLRETLKGGAQALVFRNRRGFAPQLSCQSCGYVPHCKECERPLTVHRAKRLLKCHYCGAQERLLEHCTRCHSTNLAALGSGTERLEDALMQRMAEWPVLRIDRDSTARKGALEAQLTRVRAGEPCVLVGTQMLAKGHDFPNLTAVVVVGADAGLHSLDFRSEERLAQLLFQVAGRAGRGRMRGAVFVQTLDPGHTLWQLLLAQNYEVVADYLLSQRQAAGFPPFAAAVLLRAQGPKQEQLQQFLSHVRSEFLTAHPFAANPGLDCYGPMPAILAKRAGHFRAQILWTHVDRAALHRLIRTWRSRLQELAPSSVHFSLDVDPVDMG